MATRSAYDNFIQPLENKSTIRLYNAGLDKFREFTGAKDYEELLKLGTTDNIIDFIQSVKKQERGSHPRTIRSYLTGIKHFYVMNDLVTINWTKANKFIPEVQNKVTDELYSSDELRRILEQSTERERIAFLLMLTGGLRIGALPDLKICDLTKIDGLYKVKVYAGTTSEYVTFCSPECVHAINSYLELRQRKGETIKPSSPLLAKLGDDPEPLKLNSIISLLNRVLTDSGVRIEGKIQYKRQRVTRFHSFRKWFNSKLAAAGVKPAAKERLMGHDMIALDSAYYRPTDEELMSEYLKAVDLLTISQEKTLLKQVEKLQTEVADVDQMKRVYQNLKKDAAKKDDTVEELKDMLGATNDVVAELRAEIERMKKERH